MDPTPVPEQVPPARQPVRGEAVSPDRDPSDRAEPRTDALSHMAQNTEQRSPDRASASLAGSPLIARVAVDVSLPHLDRFFDYAVPPAMDTDAVPGARVQVRFAGRTRPGFIVARPHTTDAPGKLTPLSKVVSAEPVLTPAQVTLIRAVADHWAGTFADVMRLAVPPRHAATEQAAPPAWQQPQLDAMPSAGLTDYPRGVEWLDAVRGGQSVRACWLVDPSWRWDATGPDDWTRGVAQAVVSVLTSGRGAIVVVPDGRDLDRCRTALEATLGVGTVAILRGELGPSARYRNYLSLSRGQCQVALGTRSAVFAPVRHLGLIVVVDDGDDLLAEPRAPYPHARDVAALRAVQEGAALLLASPARSCEAQQWIRRGWMVPIANPRSTARRRAPLVRVAADWDAALARDPLARATRLPHDALETIRTGLGAGPVLVQVPRAGYVVALACARCRTPVRCAACHGPVQVRQPGRVLACGWCGRVIADWACPECGGHELRAPRIGSTRTAEELGRAFPGYRLIDSAADHVVATVGSQPALVVCTPGAEPIPEAGYAAAVLLDTAVLLHRDDLRAAEEALRRWLAAVVLVRPGGDGGTVCVVGETSERAIQALVRVDPDGFATRELADRAAAGFPPAVRFVRVDGEPAPLRDLLDAIVLPDGAEVLGPVDLPPSGPERAPAQQRAVLRATLARSAALTDAVKAAMALRSARKADGVVRVQVDPAAIG